MVMRSWVIVLVTALVVLGQIWVVSAQSAAPDQLPPERGSPQAASAGSSETGTTSAPGWGQMTPEQREKAIAYSGTGNTLYFVGVGYSVAVLLLILFSGFSAKLLDWCRRIARRRIPLLLLYLAAFQLILAVATIPLDYYQGYHLEHKYGLSN